MSTQKPEIPQASYLAVGKPLGQIAFIDRSYDLGIWQKPEDRERDKEDLALMHCFNDLAKISLQLLNGEIIIAEFAVSFTAGTPKANVEDTADGIELPLLNRKRITDHRVVVSRQGREAQYRRWLLGNWGPAQELIRQHCDSYESEHARKISGGRQQASFHVPPSERRALVITRVVTPNFSFARDQNRDHNDIYLHRKFATGVDFSVGRRVSCVVVQTPRGLQGRAIRSA